MDIQKNDEIWVLSGLSGCDVTWVTDLYLKTSPEHRSCFSCAGHSILGQLEFLPAMPWMAPFFRPVCFAIEGTANQ